MVFLYRLYKRKKRKLKLKTFNLINKKFFIKGKFGWFRFLVKRYMYRSNNFINKKVFKKFIFSILNFLKKIYQLKSAMLGVHGRGLYLRSIVRGLILGNDRRRTRKRFIKKVNFFKTKKNVDFKYKECNKKEKRKVNLRHKKKVYTKVVYRLNRWYKRRPLYKGTLTHFGERGHFFNKKPNRFFFKFKRLNAVYKRFVFSMSRFNNKRQNKNIFIRSVLRRRVFGPYKIKGLKFLFKKGILREGKSRKY